MAESRLNRIEKKLDQLLETTTRNEEHLKTINGTILKHEKKLNEHESRINKLSNFRSYLLGMGALAVIIIGIVFSILSILNKFI